MTTWAADFYQSVVAQYQTLSEVTSFDPSAFDANDLPDPATATVGSAQNTANEAYVIAASAKSLALDNQDAIAALDPGPSGALTVSGTDTTAVHAFATAEGSTNYKVFLQPIGVMGTPDVSSTLVISVVKTTARFTITVNAAPGAGNSVTFDWFLSRG